MSVDYERVQPGSDEDLPRTADDPAGLGDRETADGWSEARLRLLVLLGLLATLAGVAAYGIPRIIQNVAGAVGAPACRPPRVQAPLNWSLAKLDGAVATSGLRSITVGLALDQEGLQVPDAAWTDGYPTQQDSPDPNITPARAGYEIRWWSLTRDHQVADLFVFPTAHDAARYVRQAASATCRQVADSYPIAQPRGGRALVWQNPEGYRQADVFFSRANRAYRITDVPADSGQSTPQLIKAPQQLACQLSDAICTHG